MQCSLCGCTVVSKPSNATKESLMIYHVSMDTGVLVESTVHLCSEYFLVEREESGYALQTFAQGWGLSLSSSHVNVVYLWYIPSMYCHDFESLSSTLISKIHLQSNCRLLLLDLLPNLLLRPLRPLDNPLHQCLLLSTQPHNNTSKCTSIITSQFQ